MTAQQQIKQARAAAKHIKAHPEQYPPNLRGFAEICDRICDGIDQPTSPVIEVSPELVQQYEQQAAAYEDLSA